MVVGWDVDFIIVDMNYLCEIIDEWFVFKFGWMLFYGCIVKGWLMMIIVCGKMVMCDDELVGYGLGELVKFLEVLLKQ